MRLPRFATPFAAAVSLAGCAASRAPENFARVPRAEFIVSTADSSFWVTTAPGKRSVRGEPLILARYGGRFYEIYTADDDFSYDDALLVGERVYRRDLVTNDSALVFVDTVVPRLAAAYARAHPDERPLDPDEDGEEDPATSATADVDFLGTNGPYLSYEYHVDVQLPGRAPWHSTRRGVLDLRTGRSMQVAELFGDSAAARLVARGRDMYAAERDSAVRARAALSTSDARAARTLAAMAFDARSFTLEDDDGRPELRFGVPVSGPGPADNLVELEPIAADPTPWWTETRATLPTTDDEGNDRWSNRGYGVVARYDTSGDVAHLSLADSLGREWPLLSVEAPVERIDWLDQPALSSAERNALTRAFKDASTYDEPAQSATLAAWRRPAPLPCAHRKACVRVSTKRRS